MGMERVTSRIGFRPAKQVQLQLLVREVSRARQQDLGVAEAAQNRVGVVLHAVCTGLGQMELHVVGGSTDGTVA